MKYVMDMKINGTLNNAGIKPREDIDIILKNEGWKIEYLWDSEGPRATFGMVPYRNLKELSRKLQQKDILLVQWPMNFNPCKRIHLYPNHIEYEKYLNSRKIALIHDLDSLRYHADSAMHIKEEIRRLRRFDVLIVHNRKMKCWLEENGLERPMIELGLFDYLLDEAEEIKRDFPRSGENLTIDFAGNLDKNKSKFVYDERLKIKMNLYGPNCENTINKNLKYMGSYPPNQIHENLKGNFGLVWDGISTETCSGKLGNYLRYNNPHKLSMYISAHLPVIVWKESAIAELVKKEHIGISVDNLAEVPLILKDINQDRYIEYLRNVTRLSKKIRDGEFTKNALKKSLDILIEN